MRFRRLLTCLPLLALLAVTPADAKNGNGKKHKHKAKDAVEWRNRTERDRYDYRYDDRYRDRYGYRSDSYSWPRDTRGHRPHDNNGDGIVTRNEWPGNDNSYRQLDRNRDGILSEADRRWQRNNNDRYYNWRYR